jgi:hypothetical protein
MTSVAARGHEGAPDSLGRGRHVDVPDAQMREGIDDRVLTAGVEPMVVDSPMPLAPSGCTS